MEKMSMNFGLQGQRLHDADGPDGLGGRRCHGSFLTRCTRAISLIRAVSRLTTKKKTGNATATMQPKVQFIQKHHSDHRDECQNIGKERQERRDDYFAHSVHV